LVRNNTPLVTIIALCCNQSKYVIECLESIRFQSYGNLQLIIIDDGSIDNSVKLIKDWIQSNEYDCLFFPQTENIGICKTLNRYLEYIKGDFFQVIACDDVLVLNKIERQVSQFSELTEEYALVYCDVYTINEESVLFGSTPFTERGWTNNELIPTGNLFVELSKLCFIPAPSVLIRTSVLDEYKYDEQLLFEDWDMWFAISKKFKIHGYVDKLVKYRVHSNSMFQKRNNIHIDSELRICEKYLGIDKLADKNFKSRIYNESILIYMRGGIRIKYWLWKRFLIKKSFKNLLHLSVALAGIPYKRMEKWKKRWNLF
jgi:glycosyltransferase involved in cell wall biosynthesis